MKQTSKGFTIVELLIVIVVIAILATISIIAYNGMQAKARDTSRSNTLTSVKKALEYYYTQNDKYPTVSGCVDAGCNVTNLRPTLVPTYISAIDGDPGSSSLIYYIVNPTGSGYGMRVSYETKSACKYISPQGNTGWWGNIDC